jgi:hypothetical protein
MIFLYTAFVFVLVVMGLVIRRRVAALERKYVRIAQSTEQLAVTPAYKAGNRLDPCQIAKRQYQLGQLVQKRDRTEAKYHAWQGIADQFNSFATWVQNWKGRKLPYTLGVLDVSCLFYALDYLGLGQYLSAAALCQWVVSLMNAKVQ